MIIRLKMNNAEIFYENFAGYVFFNKELKAVHVTSKGAISFGEGFRGTANNVIELIKKTNSKTLIIDAGHKLHAAKIRVNKLVKTMQYLLERNRNT